MIKPGRCVFFYLNDENQLCAEVRDQRISGPYVGEFPVDINPDSENLVEDLKGLLREMSDEVLEAVEEEPHTPLLFHLF